MPTRSDRKCCIEAEQAIRHAHANHVPSISHTCHIKGRPIADLIPGTRLTEYCSAVLQGTGIKPLVLFPTQLYAVCREMVYAFIDPKLNTVPGRGVDPPGGTNAAAGGVTIAAAIRDRPVSGTAANTNTNAGNEHERR